MMGFIRSSHSNRVAAEAYLFPREKSPRFSQGELSKFSSAYQWIESVGMLVGPGKPLIGFASGLNRAVFGDKQLFEGGEVGVRKAELCGLKWTEVDLRAGVLAIVRQLVKPGPEPIFGPPKNGQARSIALAAQTVEVLKKHKAWQAKTRLELGTAYRDHGLVFTKTFGEPLQINNLGQREYRRIIEAAGVRPIKFHGLRHTCATLLLKAGTPIKVVAERLGHKRIEMTLDIYAHALPSMQQEAADRLSVMIKVS